MNGLSAVGIGRARDRTVEFWVGLRAWAVVWAGSRFGPFAFYVLLAFSSPFSLWGRVLLFCASSLAVSSLWDAPRVLLGLARHFVDLQSKKNNSGLRIGLACIKCLFVPLPKSMSTQPKLGILDYFSHLRASMCPKPSHQ